MQVLHQNIGLDLYIFKTFLFLFKFFLFFICLLKSFIRFFFLVKQQTPPREAVGTRSDLVSLWCSESAVHHSVQQVCVF